MPAPSAGIYDHYLNDKQEINFLELGFQKNHNRNI